MLTIARLFGKSPFAPLQTHMNKVACCLEKLTQVFEALLNSGGDRIEALVAELSELEHQADLTKNDIRNHLPRNIFLPIDRSHFLEILSVQDSIADKAEDIGTLLTLRPLELLAQFGGDLLAFYRKNIEVFWDAKQIIAEIEELLESSFGGIEAEKVKSMVEQTAHKEHEASKMHRSLMKELFTHGEQLSNPSFYLWARLIKEVGCLSNLSEKLANRIRMVLEIK